MDQGFLADKFSQGTVFSRLKNAIFSEHCREAIVLGISDLICTVAIEKRKSMLSLVFPASVDLRNTTTREPAPMYKSSGVLSGFILESMLRMTLRIPLSHD